MVVLLLKLVVVKLVKKYISACGTRGLVVLFIAVFTSPQTLAPVLSQTNSVHVFPPYFLKMYFNTRLFAQCNYNYKAKEDEMGRACNTQGKKRTAYRVLERNPEELDQ
jgi:hypothetical protein